MNDQDALLKQVDSEVRPLTAGEIMQAPPTDLTTNQAAEAFMIVNHVKKLAEARCKALHTPLMKEAEALGTKTDKGHSILDLKHGKVTREMRQAAEPEGEGLLEVLKLKEIPILEAFDEVKTLKVNPSKVEFLVQTGKLTKVEVEKLRKVTYALKVEADAQFEQLLTELTHQLSAPALTEGAKGKKAKKG